MNFGADPADEFAPAGDGHGIREVRDDVGRGHRGRTDNPHRALQNDRIDSREEGPSACALVTDEGFLHDCAHDLAYTLALSHDVTMDQTLAPLIARLDAALARGCTQGLRLRLTTRSPLPHHKADYNVVWDATPPQMQASYAAMCARAASGATVHCVDFQDVGCTLEIEILPHVSADNLWGRGLGRYVGLPVLGDIGNGNGRERFWFKWLTEVGRVPGDVFTLGVPPGVTRFRICIPENAFLTVTLDDLQLMREHVTDLMHPGRCLRCFSADEGVRGRARDALLYLGLAEMPSWPDLWKTIFGQRNYGIGYRSWSCSGQVLASYLMAMWMPVHIIGSMGSFVSINRAGQWTEGGTGMASWESFVAAYPDEDDASAAWALAMFDARMAQAVTNITCMQPLSPTAGEQLLVQIAIAPLVAMYNEQHQ